MAPVNSPGCLVMPNEEVLVVGSGIVGSYRKAYAYNVQTNKWRSLSDMIHDQGMDNLYRGVTSSFRCGPQLSYARRESKQAIRDKTDIQIEH